MRYLSKGFSLVEVLITILVASIVVLSIIAGLIYVMHGQKLARERSRAQREASMLVEEARRTAFPYLEPIGPRTVLIDDNRTPDDESDDITGTAELKLYRWPDKTPLREAAGEEMIIVQSTVNWESEGKQRVVRIASHFAP